MKSYLFLILGLMIIFSCQNPPQDQQSQESPQWRSLFNGENLDGWEIKINGFDLGENYQNTFRVEDSILRIVYDDYENYGTKFGALYTAEAFTNYRLKIEYRFVGDTAKGAPSWGYRDSGVQYHCQSAVSMGKDQNFPVCLEYNLHGGNGTDERPVGQICAIGTMVDINGEPNTSFCTPAEVSRTIHGDQWAILEIDVQGDTISHWINGENILTFTNPRYNPEHELGKTFIKDGKDGLHAGHISLQSNSHPIEFRKIEIMEYLTGE